VDLSSAYAPVFLSVRVVSESGKKLSAPVRAYLLLLSVSANLCGFSGAWESQATDAILAFMVSAQLQCVGGNWFPLVPRLQRPGQAADSGRLHLGRLRRRICPMGRPGAFPLQNTGVFPLFLGWIIL